MLRKINLQFFADPGTGDAAPAAQGDAGQAGGEGQQQAHEKDPAKAFAARLGHERKKLEAEYAPLRSHLERQAKSAGMELDAYLKSLDEQAEADEAEAAGKTPEQLRAEKEAAATKEKLAKLEREKALSEEEKTLTSDPKIGKWVTENLKDIRTVAEQTGCDLNVAMAFVLRENLPKLLEATDPEVHVKAYLDKLKGGGKPIETGGGKSIAQVKSASWNDAFQASLEAAKAYTGK